MMKQIAIYISLLFCSLTSLQCNADIQLALIGHYELPTNTQFNKQAFGGLSGIEYIGDNRYIAISDYRGGQYGHPRFYTLAIDYDATGIHDVRIEQQTDLKNANGKRFPAQATVDPESIRLAPNGHLYWTSEGNYSQQPSQRIQPHLHEIKCNGDFVRAFNHPKAYNYTANQKSGGRNNKLFEALAVDQQGTVYIANEDALIQDGYTATEYSNSAVRITALSPNTGNAIKQYAYILPKIPNNSGLTFYQTNGLTELLPLGPNRFIALERAFVAGTGNTIRLVKTQITPNTTDTSQLPSLIGDDYTPMTRKLLLEITPTYQGIKVDNIEGMTWGKRLKNGHRTLVLVSDNNFSERQVTQFLAFEVIPTH